MARCCGSTGSCSCRIIGGRGVQVEGSGTPQDPYAVSSGVFLTVEDNPVFDLTLSGDGSLQAPWRISVNYKATATLGDIPDVDESARQNGYSLTWNAAAQKWVASSVTGGAGGGTVTTDASLTGDGSALNPLQVQEDPNRFLATTAAGLGFSDAAYSRLVRKFSNTADRAAASPVPVLNSLSMMASTPGRIDYYDGTTWKPLVTIGNLAVANGAQFLSASGAYAGSPAFTFVKQISVTTAADGTFTALTTADLTGWAGVLSCEVIPTGTTPWVPMIAGVTGATPSVRGTAYNLGGTVRASTAITATVRALLY